MKNGRQWLTLTLCILMLTGTSCNSSNTTETESKDTSIGTNSTETIPEEEKVDMDGFTLRIASLNPSYFSWANIQIVSEEENGIPINDAIYRRNSTIMETYNCTFTETLQDDFNSNTLLLESVTAGEDLYDLHMIYDITVPGVMPYLRAWDDVPYISLSEAWWNPDASTVFNINDKQYVTVGDTTLGYLSRAMCYLYNKNMYDAIGLDIDMYSLVKEGRWTLDIFHEIASSAVLDLNGDDTYNQNDRYGIFGNARAIYNTLIGGAGIKYVSSDENGNYQFTLPTEQNAIDYFDKLISDNAKYPHLYYNKGKMAYEIDPNGLFENGQALFHTQGMPHTIEQLRTMEDDFGILPLPKKDEAQSQYYSSSYGAVVCGLPRTIAADRLENFGILMETINKMTYTDILPKYKEVLLKSKYSRDAGSAEMIDIVFDSLFFDPGIVLWSSTIADKIIENIFMKNSTAVVSYLTSIAPVAEELIADFDAALESE